MSGRARAELVRRTALHPDTHRYGRRVRGVSRISDRDLRAINNRFCLPMIRFGLRQAIIDCGFFAGDTLAGAAIKFWHSADVSDRLTLVNFVEGDYSRSNGLNPGTSNTTKYANTGAIANLLFSDTNNNHLCFYSGSSNTGNADISNNTYNGATTNTLYCRLTDSNAYFDSHSSTGGRIVVGNSDGSGFHLGSRVSATDTRLFKNGTQIQSGSSSGGSLHNQSYLLCGGWSGASTVNATGTKACFQYSLGVGIPTALQATYYNISLNLASYFERILTNLEPETTAFLARTSGSYTNADRLALNTFIKTLKDNSIWTKLDVIQIYAFGDTADSLLNIKQNLYNATLVNSPTYTRRRGFTANNAAARCVDIPFNPTTASSPNFTQNSAYAACWSLTSGRAGAFRYDMGASSANAFSLAARDPSNLFFGYSNNASLYTAANTQTNGLLALNRSSATDVQAYTDTTRILNSTSISSAGRPNTNFAVGAVNNSGTYTTPTDSQYAAAIIGGSLTQTEHNTLRDAIATLLTYLGAI